MNRLIRILSTQASYIARVQAIRRANLIAYYPLNDAAGTTATDYGPNGLHGAYSDCALNQPGIGDGNPCAGFDGASSFVDCSAILSHLNGNEGTLLCWAKVADAGVWSDAAVRYLVGFGDASAWITLAKSDTSNNLFAERFAGSSLSIPIAASSIDWMHLAVTWSKSSGASGEFKAFFNGSQVGSTLTTLADWSSTPLGCNISHPAVPWAGLLAHAALWSAPLSAAEIAVLTKV